MIYHYGNNGVDNNGDYIETGINTSGADFWSTFRYGNWIYRKRPIEVKFASSPGKLTLKSNDLRAYEKEGANILFVYVKDGERIKRPDDRNVMKYLSTIKSNVSRLRWGMMDNNSIKDVYSTIEEEPISYMGGKLGYVIREFAYDQFFNEEQFVYG